VGFRCQTSNDDEVEFRTHSDVFGDRYGNISLRVKCVGREENRTPLFIYNTQCSIKRSRLTAVGKVPPMKLTTTRLHYIPLGRIRSCTLNIFLSAQWYICFNTKIPVLSTYIPYAKRNIARIETVGGDRPNGPRDISAYIVSAKKASAILVSQRIAV
jgi:hypothetical protein